MHFCFVLHLGMCFFYAIIQSVLCLLYRQPLITNVTLKGLCADISQRPSAKSIRYSEKCVFYLYLFQFFYPGKWKIVFDLETK